ncbi:FliM/FliN family flagellar motor switch protein, partial [bacterium]|nr:FliM/FliN family flagellar motor switch protein [bacterium]
EMQAPEITKIKDVESDAELERELASITSNGTNSEIKSSKGKGDTGLVLDESMEIKNIEPEELDSSLLSEANGLNIDAEEQELDVNFSLEEDDQTEDVPSFMRQTSDSDDDLVIELDDMSKTEDLDLMSEVFGEEEVDDGMIEIDNLGDEETGNDSDLLEIPEMEDDSDIFELSEENNTDQLSLGISEDDSFTGLDEVQKDELMMEIDTEPEFDQPTDEPDEGEISSISSRVDTPGKDSSIVGRDLLFSLTHQLTVEIGKANLKGKEIINLSYGSIIELDKKVGDPVQIILGEKAIAMGEVVQINDDQLGVRITGINF